MGTEWCRKIPTGAALRAEASAAPGRLLDLSGAERDDRARTYQRISLSSLLGGRDPEPGCMCVFVSSTNTDSDEESSSSEAELENSGLDAGNCIRAPYKVLSVKLVRRRRLKQDGIPINTGNLFIGPVRCLCYRIYRLGLKQEIASCDNAEY